MKACKFCGTEVENTKKKCPACGSTELLRVCENCGEHFDGNFCPKCGVKVGQKGKVCPECQTEYFSNACPNCGYTPAKKAQAPAEQTVVHKHIYVNQPATVSSSPVTASRKNVQKPKKKRRWLVWVIAFLIIAALFGGNSKKDTSIKDSSASNSPVKKTTQEAQVTATEVPVSEEAVLSQNENAGEAASKQPAETDMEIILRESHPKFYGSVEQSHKIWDDVKGKRIRFGDTGNLVRIDHPILYMDNSYSDQDLIIDVEIYFENFEINPNLSLNEALPIAAEYMPFDILEQYYEFKRSFKNSDSSGEEYYTVSYWLTKEGGEKYRANEHPYSSNIDVIICVKAGVVQYITIGSEKPKWYSLKDSVEWECNLGNYANANMKGVGKETPAETSDGDAADSDSQDAIYEYDAKINSYIVGFNAANPDNKITQDLAQRYYHHGREHDDQVKFIRDGFEVVLTNGYPFQVVIQGERTKTENDYKQVFFAYARGFTPEITDEKLDDYWGKLLTASSNNVKFDEFECTLKIFPYQSGDEIEMISFRGEVKE